MPEEMCLNGYAGLASAIVIQAAKDYREARRKRRHTYEVESFFASQWGNSLSMGNGTYILRKLREE